MNKGKIIFAIIVLITLGLILTNNTSVAFATLIGTVLRIVIICALLSAVGYVIFYLIGKFSK